MTRLYDLQDQLVQIDNILADNTNEETQEILESARDEVLKAIDGKVENILEFMSDCKTKVEQLKNEENRLAKKRKTLENKAEYLKGMLMWFMKTNGQEKAEFGTWNVSVAKTPERVVLDACDDDFPEQYKKYSWDIDKTALKKDMEDGKLVIFSVSQGKEIQLAHTESGETIRVK